MNRKKRFTQKDYRPSLLTTRGEDQLAHQWVRTFVLDAYEACYLHCEEGNTEGLKRALLKLIPLAERRVQIALRLNEHRIARARFHRQIPPDDRLPETDALYAQRQRLVAPPPNRWYEVLPSQPCIDFKFRDIPVFDLYPEGIEELIKQALAPKPLPKGTIDYVYIQSYLGDPEVAAARNEQRRANYDAFAAAFPHLSLRNGRSPFSCSVEHELLNSLALWDHYAEKLTFQSAPSL